MEGELTKTTLQSVTPEQIRKAKQFGFSDIKLAEIQAKVQSIMAEAEAAVIAKQQAAATPKPTADAGANGPLKPGQNPEQKMPTPIGEEEPAVETAGEAVAETSTL